MFFLKDRHNDGHDRQDGNSGCGATSANRGNSKYHRGSIEGGNL